MAASQDRSAISRVTRSKAVAKASYDRLSRWYDLIAGGSEWRLVKIGLDLLQAKEGEVILEIGHGTGKSVLSIARAVGEAGHVYGLDLSEGMHRIASDRIEKAGLAERVDLMCGDAAELPFEDGLFDAVFASFTLELFDTPEIPVVLQECDRVLRSAGRIVIVSMSKKSGVGLAARLYEWARGKLPNYLDCRPIHVTESLSRAGFQVCETRETTMWRLPVDAVLAKRA